MISQKITSRSILIELLNDNLRTIDVMQGELLDGTITIDAESDYRRTCDLTFHIKDRTYLVSEISKIWFDKLIRISEGIKDARTQEYTWYVQGIFLFNENSYQYDASTNTISLRCLDMMAKLNGILAGQIGGALTTKIPAGSNIRNAMVSVIKQLGFIDRYLIDEIYGGTEDNKYTTVPYDLEFDAGSTAYDIIVSLRDLYPGWETFFDIDGTFICQRIPSGKEDPIVMSTNVMNSAIIVSESVTNSFETVKNITEVWGKQNEEITGTSELDKFTDGVVANYRGTPSSSVSGDPDYLLTEYSLSGLDSLQENDNLGILIPKSNNSEKVQLRWKNTSYDCLNSESGNIPTNTLEANRIYVFEFKNNAFYLVGPFEEYQVHAIAIEVSESPSQSQKEEYISKYNCYNIFYTVNPDSPFCVDKIGEKLKVLSGGDYDNISTSDLARQRAQFENWTTTRLQDSVTLSMVPIYWLDVNQKIEYTSQITNETKQYIIKSITLPLVEGTMSISMITFYPYYPDII